MSTPTDRKYLESHEWHKPEGDLVVIGISQFAVDALSDITFLEVSAEGSVSKDQPFGEIESVKATSDLIAGIDGEIMKTNEAVLEDPSIINDDCYEKGWIIKIKPSDSAQLDSLMDASNYEQSAG